MQNGFQVVAKLSEARSAKTPGSRPEFEKMLTMIRAGEAGGILCWHVNRLARNPVDSGQLSWLLQTGVIKCIRTPDSQYLPGDNVVVLAVENAVANQYIVDMQRNIRRAQDEKAARGWYPTRPPAGYQTNPETREVEMDPVRFPLIRRAWDLLLTRNYNVARVHRKLAEWGYHAYRSRGRQGQSIGRSRLYLLFDNPFYYGEFIFRGQRYRGKHPPMVSREEFERVQTIIHGDAPIRPSKHVFAFTGLMRCGECGCQVTAERKIKHYRATRRTAVYNYYRCTRGKGPCSEPAVNESFIETEVGAMIDRCSLDQEAAAWAEVAILQDLSAQPNPAVQLAEQHTKALAQAKSKLTALYDLRLSKEIDAEEFAHLKAYYLDGISQLERALFSLQSRAERNRETVKNLFDFARQASDLFKIDEDDWKRYIATLLAEGYVLTRGELKIQIHPLLKALIKIEPPETPPQQVQKRLSPAKNPQLCRFVEDVLTLLNTTDVAFPPLKTLEQIRNERANGATRPPFLTPKGKDERMAA